MSTTTKTKSPSPLRAFLWWVFIYQGWPLRPIYKQSFALGYAAKDAAIAIVRLLSIPLWPIISILGMTTEKGFRKRIIDGYVRNATPRKTVELRGSMSYRENQ